MGRNVSIRRLTLGLVTLVLVMLATLGAVTQRGVNFANPVLATQGGTGQSVYAVGDLLYASTTTALSKLADVATGQVLISGGVGVAPAWSGAPSGLTSLSAATLTATTSATIGGATPTAITNIRVYAPSLTPAATPIAIGIDEQAFTVTGLTTADKVFVNGPAPTALCPAVTFRVSVANTLAIGFSDLTAAACTPAAGTYNIVAIRS